MTAANDTRGYQRDYEIVPSTLSVDQSRLGDELADLERAGADVLQWDVMDATFVPNLTVGWEVIAACRGRTRLPFEAHLMIEEPGRYVADFVRAGNERLIVHAEACRHLYRVVQQIKAAGVQAGVALNPATPIQAVAHVLRELDTLLIMTVNPGFGGQHFIPAMLEKIEQAAALIAQQGAQARIEVDGGISAETIRGAYQAGARKFVSGTAVANHPQGRAAGIAALRAALA
ncbi:MAG: ribulose-phosphate 3-epimerase [Chloroflexota bacterium]